MTVENFGTQIRGAQRRVEYLHHRATEAAPAGELLPQALEELHTALVEMRTQNEELAAARTEVEAER